MSDSLPLVFVVDDDASVLTSVGRLLRTGGYSVETFGSAEAFLDRMKSAAHSSAGSQACCAVLDVHLPGITGLDVQRALAASCKALPLVFITGGGDIPTSVSAMKAGAVDFLAKPFGAQEFLDAIARALEKGAADALERSKLAGVRGCYETLTRRERQVLDGLIAGKRNKQIGAELGAVEKTVKVHRSRIMKKMQARSFADLVRMALYLGIGQPQPDDGDVPDGG